MVCLRAFNAIWDWYKAPGTAEGVGIYAAENGQPKVWVPGQLYGNIRALEYAFDCYHAKKEPDWDVFSQTAKTYPWHWGIQNQDPLCEFITVDTSTNAKINTGKQEGVYFKLWQFFCIVMVAFIIGMIAGHSVK